MTEQKILISKKNWKENHPADYKKGGEIQIAGVITDSRVITD